MGNIEEPNPTKENIDTNIDKETEEEEDRGGIDSKELTLLPTLYPPPLI